MVCNGIVTGSALAIKEPVGLKPLNFIVEGPEEAVYALPESPSLDPQSILSQAWQEPVTSPL